MATHWVHREEDLDLVVVQVVVQVVEMTDIIIEMIEMIETIAVEGTVVVEIGTIGEVMISVVVGVRVVGVVIMASINNL